MLNNLLKDAWDALIEIKEAVDGALEREMWPVPEVAVNLALSLYRKKQMPELERLEIKVLDGCFEIHVKGQKGISFESISTFEFESCEISPTKQLLTLRQVGKTQAAAKAFHERIVLAVVQAIFLVILRTDPAAYVLKKEPGIQVSGDRYIINLAETAISDYVQEQSRLLKLVNGYAIDQVSCKPGFFEVKARVQGPATELVVDADT